MTELKAIDMPAVSSDTALELMAHYLQVAHSLFQLIPEDRAQNRDELLRLLNAQYMTRTWVDDGGLGRSELVPYRPDSPEIVAALVWLDKMEDVYEAMRREDDEP